MCLGNGAHVDYVDTVIGIAQQNIMQLGQLGPTLILQKLEESAGYHTLHIKNKFTEKLYVPPFSCAFDHDPRIVPVTDDNLPLLEIDIFEFCKPKNPQKILLLAGGAGTGKSLFGYHLQWRVWQEKNFPVSNAIFIFIDLPTLKDPTQNLMQEYFMHKFGSAVNEVIDFLKQRSSVFFILDGFDEIASFRENPGHLANLYQSNQLKEWKNAKFIINCRSSFLRNLRDYRRYFSPVESEKPCYDLLRTVQVALFNQKQINQYIEVYVRQRSQEDPSTWTITKYNEELEKISSLKPIIRTPLLLEMTMQVLPIISEWHAAKKEDSPDLFLEVTERDVFLAYLKDNLVREDFKQVYGIYENFNEKCLDFLLNLCKVLLENHACQVVWDNNKEGAGPVWAESFFGRPKRLYDEEQLKFLEIIRSHLTCFLIYDKDKKIWSFVHDTFLDKFNSINVVELSEIQSRLIVEYKQKGYEEEEAIGKARNDSITEFAEILFNSKTGPYYFTGHQYEGSVSSADDLHGAKPTLFSHASMEINSTPQGQFSDVRQSQDQCDSRNRPHC